MSTLNFRYIPSSRSSHAVIESPIVDDSELGRCYEPIMLFKSLYPPTPPVPDKNVYELFFNDPEQNALPDYTLYVDAESGRQIRRSEFNERVRDAATALGAPLSAGGLGLSGEKGDIVGILSSNCIVSLVCTTYLLSESLSPH